MTNKQFKIVTESEHFIYFVTEEDENINWCLKVAVKDRVSKEFKNHIIDKISNKKFILKIKLGLRHCPNYMRLNTYSDSPYKMQNLELQYKSEIKKAIINTNITYCGEEIPNYDFALVQWEELNDKEKFYNYETPNQELRWLTTPLEKNITGLAMNIELVMQSFGKIENIQPYIIIQNDYEDKHNMNWVKMRLDGTILNNKKLVFNDYEIEELKTWIEVNKLPILMYWTQETNGSIEILELIKTFQVIEPKQDFKSNDWESKQIIWATDLENYFNSIKQQIIGKNIDRIFYTGILYNRHWDDIFKYKNGDWYTDKKVSPPSYYPWKEYDTTLILDSPIILDFQGTRLEMQYTFGSLVNTNINSIDLDKFGADVSKHFVRNIIGQKLIDIQIHKRQDVYFMNFDHLNIKRQDGDDMFEEIWFVFENGYKLELTTDHCDYSIFSEVKS